MATATKSNGNRTATANKKEETTVQNTVNTQTGDKFIRNLDNTNWNAFQKCVDGIIKNFKADNQELEMIAAMIDVQDVLSKDNVVHLIRGDKLLYSPAKRSNAKADSVTKPSAANQQRGALLELLPHYAAIVAANARNIVSVDSEHKAAVKAAKAGRKLTDKQQLALINAAKVSTVKKNAAKGEAELQVEAIEKMFGRALAKLYYLRRVSASDVVLNVKAKTITFTGFDFEINSDGGTTKVKLFASKGEYTKTLAELSRDSRQFLLADGITSTRSNGKESKKQTTPTAATPTVELNPVQTISENSKSLAKMIRAATKDKAQAATFRKSGGAGTIFDTLFASMFVTDGKLDVAALQKSIDAAATYAKLPAKVTVAYDNAADVKQSA